MISVLSDGDFLYSFFLGLVPSLLDITTDFAFAGRFCRISWNRISEWLPIVFHFGTENWEEQLKKHPVYRVNYPLSDSHNHFDQQVGKRG